MHWAPRISRTSVAAGIVALGVGIGNPALIACNSQQDGFQFDDDDMAAAIDGDFEGTLEGKSVRVHLTRADKSASHLDDSLRRGLDQAQRRHLQCGSRSFIKPASACESTSTLAVEAVITSASNELASGTLSGWFTVWGNNLSSGDLTFDQADRHVLDATFRDGVLRDWSIRRTDGTHVALDLQRAE